MHIDIQTLLATNTNDTFLTRKLPILHQLHPLQHLAKPAIERAYRMMSQFTLVNQLLRDCPQLLAIRPNFFAWASTIWFRPGRSIAENRRSKHPVGLHSSACCGVRCERVQGYVLAAGTTQRSITKCRRLDCCDTVKGVFEVVLCIRFL